ncbi:MAG TPA: dephospho-CoA kinase [Atribacterota bacterium]|nr:dephospho-CoA kinase [Atribacterota bacterium]
MLIVGLTGGIVSGKTTVARIFERLGAKIIDLDEIARQIVKPQQKAWKKIVQNFGVEILKDNQEINRKKLAKIVFSNQEKLNLLNQITHPVIIEVMKEQLNQISKQTSEDVICMIDAPLLFEAHIEHMMDKIIVVYINEKEQMTRLLQREGLSKDDAIKRMRAQIPIEDKVHLADYVIDNSFSIEQTKEQVFRLWLGLNNLLQNMQAN